MALTLITASGLNLSDNISYGVTGIDLGQAQRDEAWIEPWGASVPVLANYVDRKTKLTLTMWVKGTSKADLIARVNAVRNEFSITTNRIRFGLSETFFQDITTYPSPIDPVDLSNSSMPLLHAAAHQFKVPSWTFSIWRRPYFDGNTQGPVIN